MPVTLFALVFQDDGSAQITSSTYTDANGVLQVGDTQNVGTFFFANNMRFPNCPIPSIAQAPQVVVTSAFLTFNPSASIGGLVTRTDFRGEAAGNPTQIVGPTTADFNSRARTAAQVNFNPPAFTVGIPELSPSLISIITEILGIGGYASGNAVQIFWGDNGSDEPGIDMFRSVDAFLAAGGGPGLTLDARITTGIHDGAAGLATLFDPLKITGMPFDFLELGVVPGQTVRNLTDGSSGVITGVATSNITATLAGGTNNDWSIGDAYEVVI